MSYTNININRKNKDKINRQLFFLKIASNGNIATYQYFIPYIKDINRFINDYNDTLWKLNFQMVLQNVEHCTFQSKTLDYYLRIISYIPLEILEGPIKSEYKTNQYANEFIFHSLDGLYTPLYYHIAVLLDMLKDKYPKNIADFILCFKKEIRIETIDTFLDKMLLAEYGIWKDS